MGEAEEYLYRAVRASGVTEVVEPVAIAELGRFLEGLTSGSAEPYGDDACYPIDSALVRVLSVTNANETGSESERARALLGEVEAALPDATRTRCFRDLF